MKHLFTGNKKDLRQRIWELDLEPICVKLCDEHGGHKWTVEKALLGVEEYKKFLYLTVSRSETIVPTEFVDEVWHTHILDTMKYAEDCNKAFGFFLHHFPYFGIRSAADQALLQRTFKETAWIYQQEFGTSYFVEADKCADCGGCGTCGGNACGSCAGSGISQLADLVQTNVRPTFAGM